MDATSLNEQLGDLAATLGDATRRGIYITVRESVEPVTFRHGGQLVDHVEPELDRLRARHHVANAAFAPVAVMSCSNPLG